MTDDTMAKWLFQRFGASPFRSVTKGWNRISQADRDFWTHEAAAVKRAVARGGFKVEPTDE